MPSWRNIPSMPKVRASSGTIGTTTLAHAGILHQRRQHAHEGHRGGDLGAARCLELRRERIERRHRQLSSVRAAGSGHSAPLAALRM
jgi:hypothetical protein